MKKCFKTIWLILSIVLLLPVMPILGIGALNQIGSKLSGVFRGGGGNQPQLAGGYPSMLSIGMGDTPFNTAAKVIALLPANGAKARIWEMTIPGGNWKYRWGSGHPALPDSMGYWWLAIAEATVGICNGVVTLAYESYDRHTYIPIEEKNDVSLNTGAFTSIATLKLIDKKQMQALPEGGSQGNAAYVQQFSRLVIDYRAILRDVDSDEDVADFNIPVTIYS